MSHARSICLAAALLTLVGAAGTSAGAVPQPQRSDAPLAAPAATHAALADDARTARRAHARTRELHHRAGLAAAKAGTGASAAAAEKSANMPVPMTGM